MRILVPVDSQPYSAHVVRQVAALAANTWANVTILGVAPQAPPADQDINGLLKTERALRETAELLYACRAEFLDRFPDADLLYGASASGYHLVRAGRHALNLDFADQPGRKALDLRIRFGQTAKEVLAEADEIEADLIVVGCNPADGCRWPSDGHMPEKIVKNAACPVFVVKENKQPQMIVGCLDHDTVTQASIELINQLVTLYQAELEIIGVTDTTDGLREDVDRRMARILAYYTARNIKAWVRIVDAPSLKSFLDQSAENNLVAVWTGKHSFLEKIFPRQHIEDLAITATSSVLILR